MSESQEVSGRKRRSREEVQRLMMEFELSGLRQNAFCRKHDLALSTLQRQLKKRRLDQGEAKSKRLVAVELASKGQEANNRTLCALEVVLGSGRRIEVREDFDCQTVRRVVAVLEEI
jgi:transposase-like protein